MDISGKRGSCRVGSDVKVHWAAILASLSALEFPVAILLSFLGCILQ